jgi:ABC-2 family transporter protein
VTTLRALTAKDLRILARSRSLTFFMVLYALALVGLVAAVTHSTSGKPRIAIVSPSTPTTLAVGGATIPFASLLADAGNRATFVRLSASAARSALASGDVVAAVTIPDDLALDVSTTLRQPTITVETRQGLAGDEALAQLRAFLYEVDTRLQKELLLLNTQYLKVLVAGGKTTVLDRQVSILGLNAASRRIDAALPTISDPAQKASLLQVKQFADDAAEALKIADASLRAVASPIVLKSVRLGGRSAIFENRAIALVIGSGVALVCVVLGAALVALERAEGTLARILRVRRRAGPLIVAKILTVTVAGLVVAAVLIGAVLVAAAFSSGIALPPASRVPLGLVLLVAACAAFGAVGAACGAVVRDVAAGTLLAVLIVVPFLLAALAGAATGAGLGSITNVFPLARFVEAASACLYDGSFARPLAIGLGQLALLTVAYGALATTALRRATR